MKKYLSMVLALVLVMSSLGISEVNAAGNLITDIDSMYGKNLLSDTKSVPVDDEQVILKGNSWWFDKKWKYERGPGFFTAWTPNDGYGYNFNIGQSVKFSSAISNDSTEVYGSIDVKWNEDHYSTMLDVKCFDASGERLVDPFFKSTDAEEGRIEVSGKVPKGTVKITYVFSLWYPKEEHSTWGDVYFKNPQLVLKNNASNEEDEDATSGDGMPDNENIPGDDNAGDEEEYTVTFMTNTSETHNWELRVGPGEKVAKPINVTKQGYKLRHWRMKDSEPYDFREPIYSDLTLVAEWEEETGEAYHIVNLDTNGGNLMRFREVQNGHALERPMEPVKTGATFKYWELNGQEYDFSLPVTGPFTLKAVWQENLVGKFTVSFETDGGTPVPPSQEVLANKKAKLPDIKPVKEHSKFLGWQRYGNDFDFENTPITESITLMANYGPADKNEEAAQDASKAKREDIEISNEDYDKAIISYNKSFFKGYPGNLFKPEDTVTRGQLATIFARLLKLENKIPNGTKSFSDLEGHWAKNAVLNVAEYGLINGYPDGKYKPDAPMKRSEIASIVNKYWELKGFSPDKSGDTIVDVNEHWSKSRVYALYNYGFVDIYTGNKYMPEAPLKRADVAQILNRITDRPLIHLRNQKFVDVPSSHWAYDEINTAAAKVE